MLSPLFLAGLLVTQSPAALVTQSDAPPPAATPAPLTRDVAQLRVRVVLLQERVATLEKALGEKGGAPGTELSMLTSMAATVLQAQRQQLEADLRSGGWTVDWQTGAVTAAQAAPAGTGAARP